MTLLEVLLAVAIISVLTAITAPRVAHTLNAIAVHGAANDIDALLTTARHVALARRKRVSMKIDSTSRTLVLVVGSDTVRSWDERTLHGVSIWSNAEAVTYSPIGVGFGATNLTMVVSKGQARETLYVSRLGRLRR